jgi:type VI secretion system secreted protein VgrG
MTMSYDNSYYNGDDLFDAPFLEVTLPRSNYKSRLQVLSFEGREAISKVFNFTVTVLPEDYSEFETLQIAQAISVCIHHNRRQDFHKVTAEEGESQWFNGVISSLRYVRLQDGRLRAAQLQIIPKFGLLSQNKACRQFVNKTALDIVESILKMHLVFPVDSSNASNDLPVLPYVVQYNESDLDFVSRLLAESGIYYYFKHSEKEHIMMLSQNVIPGSAYANRLLHQNQRGGDNNHHVHSWHQTISTHKSIHKNIHSEAITAKSNYPNLYCAKQVNITSSHDSLITGSYYTTEIHHEAHSHHRAQYNNSDAADFYQNELTLKPGALQYVPKPLKALQIPGVIPAIVKAPEHLGNNSTHKTNDAYSNNFAEIKVEPQWNTGTPVPSGQHPDYTANSDTSCWVRVSQGLAGNHFGMQFLPRINQQVLLHFNQGQPHKPIVIGGIYSRHQLPPHNTETQSGFQTKTLGSSPEEGKGHSLRLDNTPGKEQFYVKSQGDKTTLVKGKRTKTILNNSTHKTRAGAVIVEVDGHYIITANARLGLHAGTSEIVLDASGVHVNADLIDIKKGLGTLSSGYSQSLPPHLEKASPLEQVMRRLEEHPEQEAAHSTTQAQSQKKSPSTQHDKQFVMQCVNGPVNQHFGEAKGDN